MNQRRSLGSMTALALGYACRGHVTSDHHDLNPERNTEQAKALSLTAVLLKSLVNPLIRAARLTIATSIQMDVFAGSIRQVAQAVLLVLMGTGGIASCGGKTAADQAGSGDSPTSVTREQFIESYVTASCGYVKNCRGVGVGLGLGIAPETSCEEFYSGTPRYHQWLSPQLHFDSEAAKSCLDAFEQVSCAGGMGSISIGLACSTVLRGDAVAGEACSTEEDCRADFTCDLSQGCPGQCKSLPALGEPCSSRCSSGLECGLPPICTAPTRKGETCTGDTCEAGTLCDSGEGRTNSCRPFSELERALLPGQSCRKTFECPADNYCSPTTSVCTRKLEIGTACLPVFTKCMDGSHCLADKTSDGNSGIRGTCVADIPVGETCDSELEPGFQCDAGARCIGNVCAYTVKLGEPCSSHKACYSQYCEAGRCVEKPACFSTAP